MKGKLAPKLQEEISEVFLQNISGITDLIKENFQQIKENN